MLTIHPSGERGHASFGWLEARHSFSFGEYYNPNAMGFRTLRVINEDKVQPGKGFPTHPHRDMEIVTVVLSGSLAHKDSLGNGSLIVPGDVQRMSAGTGVRHSEFNASETELLHLMQIWIMPTRAGVEPGYEQQHFSPEAKRNRLCLVASPDGSEGSVRFSADARLFITQLGAGEALDYVAPEGRSTYIHVARGQASVSGHALSAGDATSGNDAVHSLVGVEGDTLAEVLIFDLP